jgi:mitochondrial fission protein ELM1
VTKIASLPDNNLVAWALTTGEAGMRTQARGLAQAVAQTVVEKIAPVMTPLEWVGARLGATPLPRDIKPPWPDIVISCGRRSVPLALRIKRASHGKSLTVHIQDPRSQYGEFDLIVAMTHDRLTENARVMKVATALHDITPDTLEAAARLWRALLEPLGRPLVGVAVGGDLRGRPFTKTDVARLLEGLRRLRLEVGGGVAITPSRRTPPFARALIAEAFHNDSRAYVWDLKGDNPYKGILALADRIVVTTDSVSMVSEAVATGRPVDLLDLEFRRHRRFVDNIVDKGLARRLTDDRPCEFAKARPDPTTDVADRVRKLIQARTGVSG